ncbi:MAG: carbon-nitrogen hydrolase family protein [bacterium JZ-2024 1]
MTSRRRNVLRLALVQLPVLLGDVAKNVARIQSWLQKCKRHRKLDLIVFPEMALMGYGAGDLYLSSQESIPQALKTLSEDAFTPVLVGAPESDGMGNLFNSAYLLDRGTVQGVHRKVQLVNYRLFDEKRYFRAGATCVPFGIKGIRVGVLICEDAWFPEPARALALRGSHLLICISASPFDRGKPELWNQVISSRALDNIIPIAFCNQVGCQDGVTFWGGSFVANEAGQILAQAPVFTEDVLYAEVDLGRVRLARRRDTRLRDVNPSIFDDLQSAYRDWLMKPPGEQADD